MSKADLPDPSKCDHEYSEPYPPFSVCCRCKKWRLPSRPSRFDSYVKFVPDHWFKHSIHQLSSTVQELASDMRTGADVLDGDFPPDAEQRHVQVCGSCGHWLSAVHADYFDRDRVDDIADGSFSGALRESLCPECGTPLLRWTMVVTSLSSARQLSNTDIQQYLIMRAHRDFWKGEESTQIGNEYVDMTGNRLKTLISDILSDGYLMPRCPACARPEPKCRAVFDFHHWDYDNDIGCKLCRWCHNHIHRGMKARKQEELTDGWRADAERRLLNHCQDNGLRFNSVRDFERRFNIPNVAMNTEIRADMRPAQDYPSCIPPDGPPDGFGIESS